jgi:hypothetical protein
MRLLSGVGCMLKMVGGGNNLHFGSCPINGHPTTAGETALQCGSLPLAFEQVLKNKQLIGRMK